MCHSLPINNLTNRPKSAYVLHVEADHQQFNAPFRRLCDILSEPASFAVLTDKAPSNLEQAEHTISAINTNACSQNWFPALMIALLVIGSRFPSITALLYSTRATVTVCFDVSWVAKIAISLEVGVTVAIHVAHAAFEHLRRH